MDENIASLTEREKETLRLLLVGHDAKSIANRLALSVHTVNERLREARRKLGVSSSREAARLLAAVETTSPKSFADEKFGIAPEGLVTQADRGSGRGGGTGRSFVLRNGGFLMMSLIVVAAALWSSFRSDVLPVATPTLLPAAASLSGSPSPATTAARDWLALVDAMRWQDSWNVAGALFKSQVSQMQWTSTIQSVRAPLGSVSSRILQSDTRTTSLPGLPAGEYEVFQFRTSFAQKRDAIETVTLARESTGWKVDGYFIR